MEQVVFDQQMVADRIRLIANAYDDLVRVKERLQLVVSNANSQTDYYSAVSSCTVFTAQYAATAAEVSKLFGDAQVNLDTVIEVFRATVSTMYASNTAIADDFAAIDNLQLPPDQRARIPQSYGLDALP